MGKNNNTNKIKARILSSDPDAGRRLNNLFLSDKAIRDGIATEVTSQYDLSHDLDAFDAMFRVGLQNEPENYFDELDNIQIGDLKIEGEEIMLLEDDDVAFEAMMDNLFGLDSDEDEELTEDDYGFAEDMFKATEEAFSVISNFEGEMDEDDLLAMEAAMDEGETEEDAYRILLEEDDDDDFDDLYDDEDDEDEDSELSDEEFLSDDIMLDPQFDDDDF